MRRRHLVLVLLFPALGAIACGSGGPLESQLRTGPAVSIVPLGVQFDAVGARQQLTATVFDAMGVVKPSVRVTWSTRDPAITTVEDGIVVARKNGTTVVEARYDTLVGTVEVRVQQVGVTLFKVSGDVQSGTVGVPLGRPLVAQVDDRLGSPVQGVVVFFEVVSGGGSLSDPVPRTDASGIAQTMWTLGPITGDQIVGASLVPGAVTPALYNATAATR